MQYLLVISPTVTPCCNCSMQTIEYRRQNLAFIERNWFKHVHPEKVRGEITEITGLANSLLSRILSKPGSKNHKTIGEKMARPMEQAFGLPAYALDLKPETFSDAFPTKPSTTSTLNLVQDFYSKVMDSYAAHVIDIVNALPAFARPDLNETLTQLQEPKYQAYLKDAEEKKAKRERRGKEPPKGEPA